MFVGDRSALFDALKKTVNTSSIWPSRGACLPLEGRLRSIMRQTASAWNDCGDMPRWKVDQVQNPGAWEVRMVLDPDPKPKWMSKVSFNQFGVVGVEVKSHQTRTAIPYPVITEGNDKQDAYCKGALVKARPSDILIPSGGPLVFLCKDGRMVTSIPNKFTRSLNNPPYLWQPS